MDRKEEMIAYFHRDLDLSILKVESISDRTFLTTTYPWEKLWTESYGTDLQFAKERLIEALQRLDRTERECDWFKWRWCNAIFDAITLQFFVIRDLPLPTLIDEQGLIKKESDPLSVYNGGRGDLTLMDIAKFSWGVHGDILLIREKLNGARMVRLQRETDYLDMCGHRIFVGPSFPSMKLEWTADGVYSLYPWGVPSFSKGDVVIRDHAWTTPGPHVRTYKEGAVVMLNKTFAEKRIKQIPTADIDLNIAKKNGYYFGILQGVWECRWNFEKKCVHPIRPRPGKHSAHMSTLRILPSLRDFDIPMVSYTVEVITEGRWPGYVSFRGDNILIDSCFRRTLTGGYGDRAKVANVNDNPVPVPRWAVSLEIADCHNARVFHYKTLSGHISTPYPIHDERRVILGAKVCLVTPMATFSFIRERYAKESEPRLSAVDRFKPIDMVGGKIEPGESAYSALLREIREEIGEVDLDIRFLGVSSAHEKDGDYHSFVYVARYDGAYEGQVLRERVPEGSVEWLTRLVKFVYAQTSSQSPADVLKWLDRHVVPEPYHDKALGSSVALCFHYDGLHTIHAERLTMVSEVALRMASVLKLSKVHIRVGKEYGTYVNHDVPLEQIFPGGGTIFFDVWDESKMLWIPSEEYFDPKVPTPTVEEVVDAPIRGRRKKSLHVVANDS